MILTSGAFDGLHSGHVAYLHAAAALDDALPLVVAVAPDTYIAHAKHRQARWPQWDRAQVVEALRVVDRVEIQQEPSVAALIRQLRPTFFVKGRDWVDRLPAEVIAACVESETTIAFVSTERTHGSQVIWS